jgi:hypothetical protein
LQGLQGLQGLHKKIAQAIQSNFPGFVFKKTAFKRANGVAWCGSCNLQRAAGALQLRNEATGLQREHKRLLQQRTQ